MEVTYQSPEDPMPRNCVFVRKRDGESSYEGVVRRDGEEESSGPLRDVDAAWAWIEERQPTFAMATLPDEHP